MKWKNITINQFNNLQEALKIEDEMDRIIEIGRVVFNQDISELPISEFKKKVSELSFIGEQIKDSIPPKNIKIGKNEYYTDCLAGRITTAQFIDFQNNLKTGDLASTLSTFIIPKGHKYNDGYDMLEVIKDLGDLPITTANSIAFFFKRQLEESLKIFQSYLTKTLKETSLPKEVQEKVKVLLTNYNNLASYLMYSGFAK